MMVFFVFFICIIKNKCYRILLIFKFLSFNSLLLNYYYYNITTAVLRITITITNVRYNFYNPGGGPDGGMPIGGGPEGGGPGGGAVSGGAVSGGGLLGGAKWGGGDRLVEGKLGGGGPLGSCKSMCVELTFRKGRR